MFIFSIVCAIPAAYLLLGVPLAMLYSSCHSHVLQCMVRGFIPLLLWYWPLLGTRWMALVIVMAPILIYGMVVAVRRRAGGGGAGKYGA